MKLSDRAADLADRLPEAIAPMCRDQDHPSRDIQVDADRDVAIGGHEQGVDHRVAGDEDGLGIDPLAKQVFARGNGRGKVEGAQMTREDPVGLLRERRIEPVGPQPRLDVAEGDLVVEACHRRREHRRRVTLAQDDRRTLPRDRVVDGWQEPRSQVDQGLVGPHDVEIEVGLDPEECQHRVDQLAMLAGGQHPAPRPGRRSECPDHRGHLDRLGTRPDRAEDRLEPIAFHGNHLSNPHRAGRLQTFAAMAVDGRLAPAASGAYRRGNRSIASASSR